jgi:hypothetical protein
MIFNRFFPPDKIGICSIGIGEVPCLFKAGIRERQNREELGSAFQTYQGLLLLS